jgi:hypothetical protein
VQPRKGAEDTYILESTIWQLVIPTILYFGDLVALMVDLHHRTNGLFHPNPLYDISCFQIHSNWVSGTRHLVGESFNFGEGGCESVPMEKSVPPNMRLKVSEDIPLSRVLLATYGICDRVLELGVVCP